MHERRASNFADGDGTSYLAAATVAMAAAERYIAQLRPDVERLARVAAQLFFSKFNAI
jgi:hypothetical protein